MKNVSLIERAVVVLVAGAMLSAAARPAEAGAPQLRYASSAVVVVAVDAGWTPCAALAKRTLRMTLAGEREGPEQRLVAATGLCPNDAAPWRELAALRLSQSRWVESRELALVAARLAPEDGETWRVVATSRNLMGDMSGALNAWNHVGEPSIETIEIHGAERTRLPVVMRAAGLDLSQVLTPEALAHAQRRLRDVPVTPNARITYEPVDGGRARVDMSIEERQVVPAGWMAYATLGARALLTHDVRVNVAGALGAGEVMRGAWSWSTGRPRVALGLTFPAPRWCRGIVSIDGSWEQQSYGVSSSLDASWPLREERRRVGVRLADWSASWLRWEAGAAVDRLRPFGDANRTQMGERDYLAVDSTLEVRLAGDRLALAASGGGWTPFAGAARFATADLAATWRSTDDVSVPSWSAATEYSVASGTSPLALWHGAGTGRGRAWLLRAHPLLSNGVLTGPVFGRDVAHGSIEHTQPVWCTRLGTVSVAGFIDAAQAWHRLNGPAGSPLFVDAGAGVRVYAAGLSGAIRIDVAHGLRGGGTTLSASWSSAGRR